MSHEFALHYNIHNIVMRYQNTRETRRARPMKSSSANRLARLRAKTFFVRTDDIDVMFALDQFAKNKEGLYVQMDVGVSSVSPGNLKKYRALRKDLRNLNLKHKSQINGSDPLAAATKVEIEILKDKMAKIKPDNYDRKLGRERAKALAKSENLKITGAMVGDNKVVIRLEGVGVSFDYVKNFKTGSVRLHLIEVDGIEVAGMLPYN